MNKLDVTAIVISVALVLMCVIKTILLVRVRISLFDVPPEHRGLVTILTDNNLHWCVALVVVALISLARAFSFFSSTQARFTTLGILTVGSAVGLLRLGQWMIFPSVAQRQSKSAEE